MEPKDAENKEFDTLSPREQSSHVAGEENNVIKK